MTAATTRCQPERFLVRVAGHAARRMRARLRRAGRHARLPAMRILALETATLAGSVALLEGGRVVGLSLLDIALTHSERLMAMVDGLLRDCRQDIKQVEALTV